PRRGRRVDLHHVPAWRETRLQRITGVGGELELVDPPLRRTSGLEVLWSDRHFAKRLRTRRSGQRDEGGDHLACSHPRQGRATKPYESKDQQRRPGHPWISHS